MGARFAFLTSVMLLVNGCSCDETLTYECPSPQPCINLLDGGIEIFEEDFISRTKGECRLGHTDCPGQRL